MNNSTIVQNQITCDALPIMDYIPSKRHFARGATLSAMAADVVKGPFHIHVAAYLVVGRERKRRRYGKEWPCRNVPWSLVGGYVL
jgi:hypothetical protein